MLCYVILNDCSTPGVHYRDLQARVYKQETRNLTLPEAQPSAVLNFEFLVCKRVLVNRDNARPKSAANVLIFSLSKPLKYMHFNYRVKIVELYKVKISCTVISHGRALLSCNRNSRGTVRPIRTLVYEN